MMTKSEKIDTLIFLNEEIELFINEVKKFIPNLLIERYKIYSTEYADVLIFIANIEKIALIDNIKNTYNKYLTESDLDDMINKYKSNEALEMHTKFYELIEDMKNKWFDAFVFTIDMLVDNIQNGDFSN